MENFSIVEGNTPVIFHVPHGGTAFPAGEEPRPPAELLEQEIPLMADLHTPEIQRRAAAQLALSGVVPFSFTNNVSRVLYDPERFGGDREEPNRAGTGAVYMQDHNGRPLYPEPLPAAVVRSRKVRYHRTYARAFQELSNRVLARFGRVLIVDLHSYASEPLPYELHQEEARPQFCLGYEDFHAPALVVDAFRESLTGDGFQVQDNEPFKGSYVPLDQYRFEPRVHSLMLAIRKDVYMEERSLRLHEADLQEVSASVANAVLAAGLHGEWDAAEEGSP